MSQTSIALNSAVAFMGMAAGTDCRDDSYAAEGVVSVGKPVILGTNKSKQVIEVGTGAGQAALCVGIALLSGSFEQSSAGVVAYADKSAVTVRKRGQVWVETDDAVAAGSVANLKLSNGKLTDEAVATGIEAFTQFSARFQTGTSGAGLALVEIK